MKKLFTLLVLSLIVRTVMGQTVPDLIRTPATPSTGSNKNNRSVVDANLYLSQNLRIPRGSAFSINNAKDSIGYVMFNTTSNRFGVYRGSGVWDTYIAVADTAAMLSSYAHTGTISALYYTKVQSDGRYPLQNGTNATGTWEINISGNAATVTNGVYTTGSYANPPWITSLAWSKITSTPTTLSGYGITDGVSLTGVQTLTNKTISGASNTLTNIGNSSLVNSSITINGTPISLGGSVTTTGGTVTSLTDNTANGVAITWANRTTTPIPTVVLGAITPTSTNGVSAATMAFNDATSSIQTQLNGKEPTITSGTSLQYWRGDKTFQTLNTSVVPELTNLYYTNARGIGSVLTGYTSGAGTISATDNVLQAIQKLNGNIGALVTGVSSFNTRTGAVTLTSGDVTTALTFTPENVANKSTAYTTINNTLYPSIKLVSDSTLHPNKNLNDLTNKTTALTNLGAQPAFTSQTANTFYAAPNGSSGNPAFRAIVAADIPTLNQNTTGSAATLTTTRTIWGQNFNGSGNVSGALTGVTGITTSGIYTITGSAIGTGANRWFGTDGGTGTYLNSPTGTNIILSINNTNLFQVSGTGIAVTGNGVFSGTLSASNLSGTNTGDETAARINALYGYTPANGANYLLLTGGALSGNISSPKGIFGGSGNGLTVMQYNTSGSGGSIYANNVTPGGANYTLYSTGTNTTLNGTTQSMLAVNDVSILTTTSAGIAVTGNANVSQGVTATTGTFTDGSSFPTGGGAGFGFSSLYSSTNSSTPALAATSALRQMVATTSSPQAFEAFLSIEHPSGTVALGLGLIGNTQLNTTATVTNLRSVQAGGNTSAAGTITNWAGFYQGFANTGGATITNGYGLYIDNMPSGVTNKYGIWQNDPNAANNFAGSITTPLLQLSNNGFINQISAASPQSNNWITRFQDKSGTVALLDDVQAGRVTQRSLTTTYAILITDYYLDCNGVFTVTLPTAVGISGKPYVITDTGVSAITVATTGGQTISGNATVVLTAGMSVTVHSDGANWFRN